MGLFDLYVRTLRTLRRSLDTLESGPVRRAVGIHVFGEIPTGTIVRVAKNAKCPKCASETEKKLGPGPYRVQWANHSYGSLTDYAVVRPADYRAPEGRYDMGRHLPKEWGHLCALSIERATNLTPEEVRAFFRPEPRVEQRSGQSVGSSRNLPSLKT